ncbi:hypothetical protein AGMMS50230_16910 [Spirochaetia bacterium]|nr:hypothetical protein AGMMS50230_16910 [Spirochaetia bacterium]
MKKLLLLAALILVVGLCFAQDNGEEAAAPAKPERLDLELSAGFPVHWTNIADKHQGLDEREVTANTALGVSLLFNFSRKFGLTLDTDFFYGGEVAGLSGSSSQSGSLFGANVLLGAVIYLYNGSFLRIPLAIGGHMYYYSEDLWIPDLGGPQANWVKTRDLQVGPGASLGVQFHFNDSIYIFSRTNVAVDIFRWHTAKGVGVPSVSETELILGWEVKPSVGLGIKF